MLNSSFLAKIQSALASVRGDREETIVLRRGTSTITAQSMRIEQASSGTRRENPDTGESRARVTILLAVGADIQVDDRFNDANGTLYRVFEVNPNTSVATIAQAEVVE